MPAARPSISRASWAVIALTVLPVVVLIVALAQRTWYPTGDLAQAELRMRSLLGHPPLVGAAGRIVDAQNRQGNHPGPLMFWGTWPAYVVLGRSAWAFEAATALVNALWLGLTVWLARRRGGLAGGWWAAVVLLILVGGYGLNAMSQPWNPWVSLLPFSALLFCTWSLLEGDRWLLPVAVLAGSWALQGHAGYALLVPPLVLLGLGAVIWNERRDRSRLWKPLVSSVVLGLACWSGPILDVLRNHPNNVQKLLANFGNPSSAPIGIGNGLKIVLQAMNPFGSWLFGGDAVSGSVVPGVLLLLVWLAAAAVAWRRRQQDLTRLNLVLAVALAFGAVSVTRIFGDVYLYVFRWICALVAAMVFSIGWSVARLVPRARKPGRAACFAAGSVVLVALVVLTSVRFVRAEIPYDQSWRMERILSPATAAHLDKNRRYLITWDDPAYLGGLGFGLLLDLERRGFHVGAEARFSAAVEPHRVMCPGRYDAVLTVVSTDSKLAEYRAKPGVRQIAYADIRTPAQRATYRHDQAELIRLLGAQGKHFTPATLDDVLNLLLLNTHQTSEVQRLAGQMVLTGVPSAVFLTQPAPPAGPVSHDPLDEPCWKRS